MQIKKVILLILLPFIIVMAGCAGGPKAYQNLDSAAVLQPNPENSDTLLFRKAGVDAKKFTKFIIDPVEIYQGKDGGFGMVSAEDQKTMAAFIRAEFIRVMQPDYEIVQQPGPNVLRVKCTLAGLDVTRPALATATRFTPIGLALNLTRSAAGMKGSFMGSVTLAVEFYDVETDTLVYAVLAKKSPNAMDVTVMLSGLDAAKKAVTEMAQKFRDTIDNVQEKK